MLNIQILKVNKKGEVLDGKIFSFDKFDHDKFDTLSMYVKNLYKKIFPAFVFCIDLELQDAIQVLRGLVNGQPQLLYKIGEDQYYFRSGNLVFFVEGGINCATTFLKGQEEGSSHVSQERKTC